MILRCKRKRAPQPERAYRQIDMKSNLYNGIYCFALLNTNGVDLLNQNVFQTFRAIACADVVQKVPGARFLELS